MERIPLYVSPEEYAEVASLGAFWDDRSKRWFVGRELATADFARWLGVGADEEFRFRSDEAFAAVTQVACAACNEATAVLTIYCDSGVDTELDHAMSEFTVFNVWAMEHTLVAQLGPWRFFRRTASADSKAGGYGNYCVHCGGLQEDYALHSEPGDVFFGISRAACVWVEFIPLKGTVRLSGDCSFNL